MSTDYGGGSFFGDSTGPTSIAEARSDIGRKKESKYAESKPAPPQPLPFCLYPMALDPTPPTKKKKEGWWGQAPWRHSFQRMGRRRKKVIYHAGWDLRNGQGQVNREMTKKTSFNLNQERSLRSKPLPKQIAKDCQNGQGDLPQNTYGSKVYLESDFCS
jgi:hypothetical protein